MVIDPRDDDDMFALGAVVIEYVATAAVLGVALGVWLGHRARRRT
jgi:hypothetical protein